MRSFLLGLRLRYIPVGSRRERIYHLVRLLIYNWRRNGFISALGTVYQRARFYLAKEFSLPRSGYSYQQWIYDHEPNKDELKKQRASATDFDSKPVISIITPVFNPAPDVLRDTIESVLEQTYPYWELCLADGGSSKMGVAETLDRYRERDQRIKVKHLSTNLGISGNSNAALGMASGDYVALLDHDDLLAPDMLFEVAQLVNQHPDAEIIYFDEDKISSDGRTRLDPFFKPSAWSPDLLLSTNYLMHSVISHSLVDEGGGFRSEMDGAQDWDLSLRLTRKKRHIYHIPKVFYHWRQVPGSAAREAHAKSWAFAAQARCIEDHLHALGAVDAPVDFPDLGRVHISWHHSHSKVSIIIPNKDKAELLSACIGSILEKTQHKNYEVLVIDTGSEEQATLDYYEQITQDPRVSLHLYPHRFNYQRVNNFGARLASGEFFLFLNNDTEVLNPAWLDELSGWADRPGVGVVGTKLLYPGGNIQHAGIVMGVEGHGSHIFEKLPEHHYGPFGSPDWYRDYKAVMGACMMVPRLVFQELGGFDEAYQIGYGDIDICLRAGEAGYRVVYTPFAELMHHEGGTRGLSLPPSDVLRASALMYEQVREGDPFYNPNLSYLRRQPTPAAPGEPKREQRLLRILHEFGLIDTTALEFDPIPGNTLIEDPLKIQAHGPPGKKLLFISHEMSLTGAPLILLDTASYLVQQGFGITVISPITGPLQDKLEQIGVEVIINPLILRDARQVLRYLGNCDLLLGNTILSWRSIYAARAWSKPCVWWIHESQFGLDHIAQYPQVEGAFQAADLIVFPSRQTADIYTSQLDGQPYEVVLNGLNLKKIASQISSDSFPVNRDKFSVVNVASYESRKGQDILINSLNQLPEDVEIDCYLIGRRLDWWFSQLLAIKARRRKNVHILGELPNEDVLAYIQATDVFVLPSRDEALPMTLLEAMYFSKPIIASRAGGVPEIITHGENGLILEVGDERELAKYLVRLYQDRDFGRQLGHEGYERLLRDLSGDTFSARWVGIISNLIGKYQ